MKGSLKEDLVERIGVILHSLKVLSFNEEYSVAKSITDCVEEFIKENKKELLK